jgi:hypothetical protein
MVSIPFGVSHEGSPSMKSRTYLIIVLALFALVIAGVLLHGAWDTAAGTGNGM